jgi:hypothetical protein
MKREYPPGGELLLALDPNPGRYVDEDPRLIPGDHVKVGFRTDVAGIPGQPNGEWMFLEVTAVNGSWPDAVYRGKLCNTPFLISPARLRRGQPVEFRAGHVYQVVRDSPSRPDEEREQAP